MTKSWVEMSNGVRLAAIPFVAWFKGRDGNDVRFTFTAPNPPIYAGDSNLFSRLSYEGIKALFAEWGVVVDHIIRGECSESGARSCYVYTKASKVPFAVIRPGVFE